MTTFQLTKNLRAWRDETSKKLGRPGSSVLWDDALNLIAEKRPEDEDALFSLLKSVISKNGCSLSAKTIDYTITHYGDEILQLIHGTTDQVQTRVPTRVEPEELPNWNNPNWDDPSDPRPSFNDYGDPPKRLLMHRKSDLETWQYKHGRPRP